MGWHGWCLHPFTHSPSLPTTLRLSPEESHGHPEIIQTNLSHNFEAKMMPFEKIHPEGKDENFFLGTGCLSQLSNNSMYRPSVFVHGFLGSFQMSRIGARQRINPSHFTSCNLIFVCTCNSNQKATGLMRGMNRLGKLHMSPVTIFGCGIKPRLLKPGHVSFYKGWLSTQPVAKSSRTLAANRNK